MAKHIVDRREVAVTKRSEEITNVAIAIAGLKARAEILEVWDVSDALANAYSGAILHVRLAMEDELERVRRELDREEVEV